MKIQRKKEKENFRSVLMENQKKTIATFLRQYEKNQKTITMP